MHGTYSVAMPHALMVSRPTHAMYVRRRVIVLSFLVTLVLSLGLATQHGLADRGTGPASGATVGRSGVVPEGVGESADSYVVQPGDTMWTIAERVASANALADYVEALIALHGGTTITVGELIRLP